MKARDLIGRKIVSVEQQRFHDNGEWCVNLDSLTLDNGTIVSFLALETQEGGGFEPYVRATAIKPKKKETD